MESQGGILIGEASSGMSISKGWFKWWQDWSQPGLFGGHHDHQAPLCTSPLQPLSKSAELSQYN